MDDLYSVRLVDVSEGGETVTLIGPTTLAGANSWRPVARASVDPSRLSAGHEYRLLMTTTYVTGSGVVVSGNPTTTTSC